jgi:F-type H+-transporting ATPase subunit delta
MKQQLNNVARVYAESLFELAEAAGGMSTVQDIGGQFAGFAEIIRGDRTFAEFLRTPTVDTGSREETLKRALSGRISDLLLRFILIVNRKRRGGELASIEAAYDALVQERLGKVEVDVWTAGPLSPDAVRAIQARVSAAIGKDAVLHAYTEPAMIGGIKLRIGDRLIDGSIAAKLRAMRSSLIETGGAAVRGTYQQYL